MYGVKMRNVVLFNATTRETNKYLSRLSENNASGDCGPALGL